MNREHILAEIRRTAVNGTPLGKEALFKVTGIREADWRGKFWARWSDAVKDAGFQPNKFNQTPAFEDQALIEKVIQLTRELGHFPVVSELRLKKRTDSTFPNDKTILRRFGTVGELAAKTYERCTTHAEYADVAVLLGPLVNVQPAQASHSPIKATSDEEFGFIYLLKSGRYYKIGRSNAVGRREYELAIQMPEKTTIIHYIKTDDPAGIEAYWHHRFKAKHKRGEWFDLDATDITAFRRRTFM